MNLASDVTIVAKNRIGRPKRGGPSKWASTYIVDSCCMRFGNRPITQGCKPARHPTEKNVNASQTALHVIPQFGQFPLETARQYWKAAPSLWIQIRIVYVK